MPKQRLFILIPTKFFCSLGSTKQIVNHSNTNPNNFTNVEIMSILSSIVTNNYDIVPKIINKQIGNGRITFNVEYEINAANKATKTLTFTGFKSNDALVIDDVINALQNLPIQTYQTNNNIPLVQDSLFISGNLGIIFTTTQGATITYSHPAISTSGLLKVTFKVSKGKEKMQTIEISTNVVINKTIDLSTAKIAAKHEINDIQPIQNENTSLAQNEWRAIHNKKEMVLQAIDATTNVENIKKIKNDGIRQIQDAIKIYQDKVAQKKELVSVKQIAKQSVNDEVAKVVQHADKELGQNEWKAIDDKKNIALQTIDNATNIANIERIQNDGIRQIQEVIKIYQDKVVEEIQIKMTQKVYNNQKLPSGFTIPEGVTSIIKYAFKDATLPTSFAIPNSVTKIGIHAFDGATLPNGFTIPNNVQKINRFAFESAKLPLGFSLPNNIRIKEDAFKNVKVPLWCRWFKGNDQLNKAAQGATIRKIPNINNIIRILDGEFQNRKLPKNFTLPNNLKIIGANAFRSSTLPAGFTLPNSVTTIGDSTFKKAILPNGFQIPSNAKFQDNSFQNVKLPPWHRWFNENNEQVLFPTPGSTIKKASQFEVILQREFEDQTLNDDFKLPDNITRIFPHAFQNAILPKNFSLPQSLTHIYSAAFKEAIVPKDFTIPKKVVVTPGAFQGAQYSDGSPFSLSPK